MSDTAEDIGFHAEELLRKSKTGPLRQRMQQFVEEHGDDTDLKTARKDAGDGEALSDIVIEQREERL